MMTKKEMQEMIAQMQAQMQAQAELIDKLTAQASARKDAPKKMTKFTKADGTVVDCTEAQAQAWAKWRDGAGERKAAFEEMKAGWADKRSAYKPSKALKDAIKANRAAITHKIAKEQYGFVGTKKDLSALKDSICK